MSCRRRRGPPCGRPGHPLPDADRRRSARLLIDRSAAWLFDYYPLRVLRELPDGACEAAMTYASDEWMARFVLGFGSAVRILEPESLARKARESAEAALSAYAVNESDVGEQTRRRRLEVTKLGAFATCTGVIKVIAVFVLLFGAKKLLDAARSLGKSMRIFKSEIKEMQVDLPSRKPQLCPMSPAERLRRPRRSPSGAGREPRPGAHDRAALRQAPGPTQADLSTAA